MLESHAWTWLIVNPIKLETGLRPYSAGILYTLLSRIEAIGFPTFGLLPSLGSSFRALGVRAFGFMGF